MEVDHKDMLDKNYMLFTELLRFKSIPVIQYLYDEQILMEKDAKDAMSLAAHTLRTYSLLDSVLKSNSEDVKTLYAATLYTKLWKAADILEPKKRPHVNLYEGPKIPLPDVWPDEEYFKELEEKELEINKVDPKDTIMQEWYDEPKKNNIYEMRKQVKGRVIIINNYKFDNTKLGNRSGSDEDVKGLVSIFKRLGFEPHAHTDLTCREMNEVLQKESKLDHTNYDCFFLIIMSHGHKGVVFGTDGYRVGSDCQNCLRIDDIKGKFVHVKTLERKPKVIIIQACQGSYKNRGVKTAGEEYGEEEEEEEDFPEESGAQSQTDGGEPVDVENEEADDKGRNSEGDEDEEDVDDDIPSHPVDKEETSITAEAPFHFLLAIATTQGYYAHRHPKYGAWFTQAFIYVLAKYAWKEDLLTLMEKVNDLVRKAKTPKDKRNPQHVLQVSETTNTFTKKFLFFPGMPLEKPHQARKPALAFPGMSLPNFDM